MKIRRIGISIGTIAASFLLGFNVYATSYGSVQVDTLNARQSPNTDSSIVRIHSKNETVKIIDQFVQDWFTIEYEDGAKAYVKSEYVNVYKVKAKVTGNGVNLRNYPSVNSTVIKQLSKGQMISAHYKVNDWYYVSLGTEATFGFVHQSYIEAPDLGLLKQKDISEVKDVSVPKASTATAKNGVSNKVISYAKQFLGNPYRYGGTSLTKGADCSGFTQQIMKHVGVTLPRSSAAQYASKGVKVSSKNLQPGDLMFYGYKGKVSHVAIYIGNSKVIHANDERTGITIGNAFPTKGKPFIGAKRVI